MSVRDRRQAFVGEWARTTFVGAFTPRERIARLLEEVIELAQAEDFPEEAIAPIVDVVYRKDKGVPEKEVGDIGLTLLAYCACRGISADALEAREWERVAAIDPEHFRKRHNAKADAGIAARIVDDTIVWAKAVHGRLRALTNPGASTAPRPERHDAIDRALRRTIKFVALLNTAHQRLAAVVEGLVVEAREVLAALDDNRVLTLSRKSPGGRASPSTSNRITTR